MFKRSLIMFATLLPILFLSACLGSDDGTDDGSYLPEGDKEAVGVPWDGDGEEALWPAGGDFDAAEGSEDIESAEELENNDPGPGELDPSCAHFDPNDELRILACKMLNHINLDRAMFPEESAYAERLVWDEEMYPVALAHSQDMCNRDYFAHYTPEGKSPFDRMTDAGVTYTWAGENIAWTPFVLDSQYRFMAECVCDDHGNHRSNCLNPNFTRVGIGIVKCGAPQGGYTYHYITQNYRALKTEHHNYSIPYCENTDRVNTYWTEPASSVTPDSHFGLQDRDNDEYTTCSGGDVAKKENRSGLIHRWDGD